LYFFVHLESLPNNSGIGEPPRFGVAKSNSENSLNNVNLADSILPEGEVLEGSE